LLVVSALVFIHHLPVKAATFDKRQKLPL